MRQDCQHRLDWDQVWLPAKLFLKEVPGISPPTRVIPMSKYWQGDCLKCGKLISEMELPYYQA